MSVRLLKSSSIIGSVSSTGVMISGLLIDHGIATMSMFWSSGDGSDSDSVNFDLDGSLN
jgi:hypothetical protein